MFDNRAFAQEVFRIMNNSFVSDVVLLNINGTSYHSLAKSVFQETDLCCLLWANIPSLSYTVKS